MSHFLDALVHALDAVPVGERVGVQVPVVQHHPQVRAVRLLHAEDRAVVRTLRVLDEADLQPLTHVILDELEFVRRELELFVEDGFTVSKGDVVRDGVAPP